MGSIKTFFVKKQMVAWGVRARKSVNERHHPAMVNSTPSAPAVTATAYGALPSDAAPVAPEVNVPRLGGGTATATAVPVVATTDVPGQGASAAPAQASTYYDPNAYSAQSTQSYNQLQSNQHQSFNNGNTHYNTEESSFWECSVCTFPNRRTEPNCKERCTRSTPKRSSCPCCSGCCPC